VLNNNIIAGTMPELKMKCQGKIKMNNEKRTGVSATS